MPAITTVYKHKEEIHTKTLTEWFETDKEARESFNSNVRFYTRGAKGYEIVHIIYITNDGKIFNFDYSNGE